MITKSIRGRLNALGSILPTILVGVVWGLTALQAAESQGNRPNVLLIAVDDLNDWIGCFGGHPQAKTPNIDRLAARGVVFSNAHCQSPVCNPSRASMMTSLYPETTGIYFLNPSLHKTEVLKTNITMPERFAKEGYQTAAAGKLFHDNDKLYFQEYGGNFGGFGPLPETKFTNFVGNRLWDWGVYPESDDETPDFKIANWAIRQLGKESNAPLFLAAGFYRPHVPQYASQKWFDLYPMETLEMPVVIENDLDDISKYANNLTHLKQVAPSMEWVVENNQWKPLVQSYLACVSFVDNQIGRLLDALDQSVYKDNTFIVLYSDHGFHLGEKERFEKRSIWKDGAGVPLIIVGPGVPQGLRCGKPVELLDIYPTLLELTGLAADPKHEGQSLVPLLKNPKADWPHWARSSFGPGNVAIVSEGYRYIHYNDGSEEFYDSEKDPHEWHNIIKKSELAALIEQHRALLPKESHPILGKGATGHQVYSAAEAAR